MVKTLKISWSNVIFNVFVIMAQQSFVMSHEGRSKRLQAASGAHLESAACFLLLAAGLPLLDARRTPPRPAGPRTAASGLALLSSSRSSPFPRSEAPRLPIFDPLKPRKLRAKISQELWWPARAARCSTTSTTA